ncbi:site-specific DNA-methyltransferase [Escherichia marmotae]|uniref:DNA-methyltransferase n=1 Tax=Escherichia TaxID=561 RepID=UPI0002482C4A|nr:MULTISPECIES: site-specific DNA-methyltransferase [Escherichia]MCL0881352.1 site-specific DNA-methyltransferase [Escherichia marmotae]MCL0884977.1 site-specific DNA-methyltransferase [Escherichia marmotae]MCL0885316.1 site-specific DNA-methyltransferase [Escherichia marmotae]MCL0885342.1 site-specific DNA-methyltransferase [Escherichia marmotae]MCL0885710.1 site-specific DNA-methyltransferase [Escherichia marmotae]
MAAILQLLSLEMYGMLKKATINIKTDEINLYQGDCLELLTMMDDSSVDLIVTSPPYADQRKRTYGGIAPDKYVDWFSPIAEQLLRVLKPSGSFVLNIKEKVVNGERHTYVLELILKMRELGWLWTEEYIWHKKNSFPGKWPNRFRDSWERCLHFTKNRKFAMYQEAVMVPVGDWKNERLKKLSSRDMMRDESRVGSGFGKNISNWQGREMAYPTNVLHMATECGNKGHSAAFPEVLPEWFIRLFTTEGDVVLDPFAGSGTTLVAASRLSRKSVGFELLDEHCQVAKERLGLERKRLTSVVSYSKKAE